MLRGDIIGDAKVLSKLMLDLRQAADDSLRESMEGLGYIIRKETRKAIINNSPSWVSLNPQYLAYKKSKGYRRKIYMMTKSLYTSINHDISKSSQGYQLKVGFPRTKHPVSKTPLSAIADAMEFGKGNLPPRPLLSYSTPRARKEFLKSKYTPDKIFKKKADRLISMAASRVSTFRNY